MPFDLGLGASIWMAVAILVAAFIRGLSLDPVWPLGRTEAAVDPA